MFRILICSLLVAMWSAGSPASVGPASGPQVGQPPGQRFGWPLAGPPTVVRTFQPPVFRYGPGHRGVDLAAVAGAPVLAAGAGTVIFAGMVAGHGVVSVNHEGRLRTTYEPVVATVVAGQWVAKGAQIGTVQPGHAGCSVPVCLHWGAFRSPTGVPRPGDLDREYLDPLRLIARARVRLLPIDGRTVPAPGAVSLRRLPASCSGAGALPGCAAGTPEIR
ncbi:MAG TPA: M23 family metallopeptidase [Pseudonocardiaceae bacterium]|nr:M23 family metallopeptidase [Pseudonocardiaceae bacterium]